MMLPAPTPPRPVRYRSLDGLRAIAVSLVVLYHLFPGLLFPAGFIGVDVFFVISGFLITTLLLREHARTGGIRLAGFWRRRARRLLPALAVVVTVCASAAWLIGGDVLVRMGVQILGAATFSYNWVSVAAEGGYFSAATPELFRNLWSLAVEEQFYVLWPLVLPLFLLLPRAWARGGASVLLALASAGWMASLVSSGGDPTRAYFGTDTHAFGILLGVALAFVLQRALTTPPAWIARTGIRLLGLCVGFLAVGGLVALAAIGPVTGTAAFPGTLLAASVLTVAAISVGVWSSSWFGVAIDIAPLRWIGDRSYALYLWHWPMLVLLVAATATGSPDVDVPVWIGLTALALSVGAAELSGRWIERPIRHAGFRGTFTHVWAVLRSTPTRRWRAVAAIAVACAFVAGSAAAVASAPSVSSAQAAVDAGRAALAETPQPEPADAVPPSPDPTPSAEPLPPGDDISAVGDSVMLASAPALTDAFPGISIDAEVSRSMWAGPTILDGLARRGELRHYVVVALGTNGTVDPAALDEVRATIGPDRDLILVDAFAPRSWIAGVNDELRRFADAHTGVVIADWSGAIASHVDLLAGDQIHPGDAGGRIFTDAVAAALPRAERERVLARIAALQQTLVGPAPEVPEAIRAR